MQIKGPSSTLRTLWSDWETLQLHISPPPLFCSFSASNERHRKVKMPSHNETVPIRKRRSRRKRPCMAAASPSLLTVSCTLLRLQPTLWNGLEVNNDNSKLIWSKAPLFPFFFSFYVVAFGKDFILAAETRLMGSQGQSPSGREKKNGPKLYFCYSGLRSSCFNTAQ